MSAFGENSFKSDIYENLDWIAGGKLLNKIKFIHENILNLIEGEPEDLDSNVLDYINERNITIEDAIECLSEVYSYLVQNYRYFEKNRRKNMYKYNEFTEEEFEYFDKKTSGTYTYLAELDHGTKFIVENGNWNGKTIHKENGIYIQTTWKDSLCENGENQIKIDGKYAAWIKIID